MLDTLQLLGLVFGLLGVFSISYIDHLANKAKLNAKLKKAVSEEKSKADTAATATESKAPKQ